MRGKQHAFHLFVVGLTACAACTDDAAAPAERSELSEPIAIRRDLAFVDREHDELWWAKLPARGDAAGDLEAKLFALPSNPVAAKARSEEHGELVVQTAGLRGVDEGPRMLVLDSAGDARKYELGAAYTAFEISEDGHYALAHFAGGTAAPVFAPSQVAVIDLDAKPPNGVHELALDVDGHAAASLWLSPRMRLGDEHRQFALASFSQRLLLLDLANPDRGPVSITLTGDPELELEVKELAFLPHSGRIGVRVAGLSDLFVLRLLEARASPRGLRVEVDQLPAGELPLQLVARSESSESGLLLLTEDGSELWSFDAEQRSAVSHPLDVPSQALLHCTKGCRYVLGYTLGSNELNLIDLDRLGEDGSAAARKLRAVADVSSVMLDAEHGRGYLLHDGGALTLVDLDRGTLSPLSVPAPDASHMQIAPDGAVWFAAPGDYLIARFDPETRQTREVLLEQPIEALVLVPEIKRAVVVHRKPERALSVLDAVQPRAVEPRRLQGPR